MSGTSLDGDFCWVEFSKNKHWDFKILAAETESIFYRNESSIERCNFITSNGIRQL